MPGVDESTMPRSLLEQFTEEPRVVALLRLLAPMSTTRWLDASAM